MSILTPRNPPGENEMERPEDSDSLAADLPTGRKLSTGRKPSLADLGATGRKPSLGERKPSLGERRQSLVNPSGTGRRQSLVDLSATLPPLAKQPSDAKPLRRRYNPHQNCVLNNTGFGWEVDITGPSSSRRSDLMYWSSELSGGPLTGCYRLVQFHMHSDNEGCKHTVDGQSFAGEIHFLHWNCDKYESFEEAAFQPDGLAMLCVLVERDAKSSYLPEPKSFELHAPKTRSSAAGAANKEMQKITDLMGEITAKGQQADIGRELDLSNLLPASSSYWTYVGSVTNPPGNESIVWIVCKEPITISQAQLDVMRAIGHSEDEDSDEPKGILFRNFCPPPLITRRLRACRE